MALTANREVSRFVDQEMRTFKVADSAHIFKGALVGLTAGGYARPLVAGDAFIGIAYEERDNSAGSDGDLECRVITIGDFEHALSGASVAHVGRPVFASADNVLTFTAAGNSYVGIAQDVPETSMVILRIDPHRRLVKTIVHAVENLAADADIAARAIHTFGQEAWITGVRVLNQATAAQGIDNSNTCVVALAIGVTSIATKTYNASAAFPLANASDALTVASARAAAGDVLTLAVTNGTAADPGPFLVEVDYV